MREFACMVEETGRGSARPWYGGCGDWFHEGMAGGV